MPINSNRLNAFYQVAIQRNFHKAAESIHITQSALSQRILKLEEDLGVTLVIRASNGIALTEAGEQLFTHAQDILSMEEDTLNKISSRAGSSYSGILRIASYSSILQSAMIPALAPLIEQSPEIHVEFASREMRVMPTLLKSGEVDFITLDHQIQGYNLESIELGSEELVHVRHKEGSADQVFLDHDVNDMTTLNFLNQQAYTGPEIKRSYYDDIYGILTGLRHNLGQAVISRHLFPADKNIICIPHKKKIRTPVILYYNKNRYLTHLQKAVIECLKTDLHLHLENFNTSK